MRDLWYSGTGSDISPSIVICCLSHSTSAAYLSASTCCSYQKDNKRGLEALQNAVLLRKSGSTEWKNAFSPPPFPIFKGLLEGLRPIHTWHAVPMPFPCHAVPLIHTCHAALLPCSDSAVSFVKVCMVAGNIQTASPAA